MKKPIPKYVYKEEIKTIEDATRYIKERVLHWSSFRGSQTFLRALKILVGINGEEHNE